MPQPRHRLTRPVDRNALVTRSGAAPNPDPARVPETPPLPTGLPTGTLVLTPAGAVPVEALRPGALVLAVGGGAPFQPVAETRRLTLAPPFIRLRAGAIADGAPQDDLLLPPDHAVLVDGVLVAARDLVDGHGIVAEDGAAIDAVQIVLAAHDAVLADGLAVETAHPEPGMPDCAPRAAPDATLRALLAWRAEAMGWRPAAAPAPTPPLPGSLRERLATSPGTPVAVGLPFAPRGRA